MSKKPTFQDFDPALLAHIPIQGTDTGTANAYAVTLPSKPAAYVDGMAVAVKITNSSNGASTINVNGLGAIPILKGDGTAITTDLVASGIYTLRYNATTASFILQGEGGLSSADKQTLVNITNAAQANDTTMRGQFVSKMNADDTSLNLPSTASWNDILNGIDTVANSRKQFAMGRVTTNASTSPFATFSLPFKPSYVFMSDTMLDGTTTGTSATQTRTMMLDVLKGLFITNSATNAYTSTQYGAFWSNACTWTPSGQGTAGTLNLVVNAEYNGTLNYLAVS